ncbi:hypothetical protein HDU67_002134 [Dinochytrium kinnereticum]|nr:hypothetical protein HDU67_002134 [Dinochytrium kinnereticum]
MLSISTLVVLLLASSASVANAQVTADPCSAIRSGGVALDAAAVYACFNSFPLSESAKTAQIDALLAMTEVYPYTSIAKPKIDIVDALRKIQEDTTIRTEFEFNTRISKAIHKLEDGHFSYAASCYSAIQFFQPWVIAAKYTAGSPKPTLYLRDVITAGSTISIDLRSIFPSLTSRFSTSLVDTYTAAFGDRDPSIFIGYEIQAIDGMDPVAAVQQFADDYIGATHTPETRFNFALAQTQYSKGLLQVKDGPFFTSGIAQSDAGTSRNYTLRNPATNEVVTLSAPWLGLYPSASATSVTSSSYRRLFCGGNSGTLAMASSSTYTGNPFSAIEYVAYLQGLKIDEAEMATLRASQKSAVKNSPPRAVLSDDFSAFYYLPATKTGVFAMPGFIPYTPDGELTEELIIGWLTTMASGLQALERQGATNLLIDFTNNGGGIICIGKALLSYLFRDSKFVQYDIRLTDTLSYLVENSFSYVNRTIPNPFQLNGNVIPDGSTSTAQAVSTLISKAKTSTRGGVTEKYSGRFDIDCLAIEDAFKTLLPQLTDGGWNPANVAIISNGFCGSTCGESVRSLRAQYGVKTFVYGGYNGKPFQPTAFEGGSVLDYDRVLDAFGKISLLSSKNPPKPLPSSFAMPARGNLLFWQSYSNKSQDIPDEWIDSPADEFIAVSDSTEVVEVWNAVAAKMPTIKQPPLKPSGKSAAGALKAPQLAIASVVAFAFMFACL